MLRAQVRAAAGRNAEPTAAVIDSQSVRAADTVPKASRGWDNAKKVNGRTLIWADAAYTGKLVTWAATLKMTIRIVAERDRHAFEVLPRRRVVEQTFACISKHRSTTRDYEHLPASHEAMILWAMILWAMIALMARRLARPACLSGSY